MAAERVVLRQQHSAVLKALVLQQCAAPGASATKSHDLVRPDGSEPAAVLAGVRDAGNVAAGTRRHPDRATSRRGRHEDHLADRGSCRVRGLDARVVYRVTAVIRIDALWLAVRPMDIRAGTERLLASVVQVLGQAQAHHGYLVANARATHRACRSSPGRSMSSGASCNAPVTTNEPW